MTPKPHVYFLSAEERGQFWKQMVELDPPYTDYQKNAKRVMPAVVLGPIG